MTRSISLFALALAWALGSAAQAQDASKKPVTPTVKSATAAKAVPKSAPTAAAPGAAAQSNVTKALAPVGERTKSMPKEGQSDCHSKDSDA